MKLLRAVAACLALLIALVGLVAPKAEAAPGSDWTLTVTPLPSNFTPGLETELLLMATNVGARATTAPSLVTTTLPESLTPLKAAAVNQALNQIPGAPEPTCLIEPLTREVGCETTEPVGAGFRFYARLTVGVVPSAIGSALIDATIRGGGAPQRTASISVPLQEGVVPFGFSAPGLQAPLSEEDGTPAVLAGSRPYQQALSFGFPSETPPEDLPTNSEHPHEVKVELPVGLIGDPAATPVLCTEVQLQHSNCPASAQVGIFSLATTIGSKGNAGPGLEAIYNMVPPPGYPAELGFDVEGIGIFTHLLVSVRSDGDYGIDVTTPDVIALGTEPLFNVQTQVWGDPSSSTHTPIRRCGVLLGCSVPPQETAFLSLPGNCSGAPITTVIEADSWEEPGLFKKSTYQSADLASNPVVLTGCNQLAFEPTIAANPTSNLTDSPSGLDVDLHQPQSTALGQRAYAALKDAVVTLPEGMSANPSQADGLGACSTAQIGLITQVSATPVHFDKTPNDCPDASRLGTVEVATPLIAEYNETGTKAVLDPVTGNAIPRPLKGSVYLAAPFDNPFDSLLAIYLTVEDPQTGTVAKLAGQIELDPQSGQITTRFSENPQLPLEDVRLHLYPGARASLITPPTCGTHTTTTDLVPWSSPEGADAHPSSAFQTTAAPGGGACPQSADQAPNSPSFVAGTLNSQAGAYAPFVLKLSREDSSQRLSGFDTLLPAGLTGKLAGVGECPEARIAQATSRSHPEEGIAERQDPSCPASSALGIVNVAAGAGPTPYYVQGSAYLAGPYKGAPLSMVVITPVIAGPFDLGVVVVRATLYVDPTSARIHAVSDPFPTILDGIPLDLRSVAVRLDRPSFTLNPTSCDPMEIAGSAISAFGQTAPIGDPFQVGGCSSLAFKPKLTLRLKGGTRRSKNPALRATLTMPPGSANVAKASVGLPHSEFLDQTHIRTVCTRVQFADAGGNGAGCPAGSVYGRARAITPLLDAPLEGPVFLRSSDHLLPDLVAALHGRIDVDLVGRIDSHKGGIRTTFEGLPDAPVSKFVLEMQGGKKGLLENSLNLCRSTNRATALFDGQNGKVGDSRPVVRNGCRRKSRKHSSRR